jgi:hypothetical protein
MSMKAPGMKGGGAQTHERISYRAYTLASPRRAGTPTATIGGFAALAGATRLWLKTKTLFALSKPAGYASKSGYFCGGDQRELLI